MDHECLHHRLYNRIDGDGNLGRPFWAKARFLCRDLIVWNHLSVLRPRAKRKNPDCRPISPRSHWGRCGCLVPGRGQFHHFPDAETNTALGFMNGDLAVLAGVITAELHPFSVAMERKSPE